MATHKKKIERFCDACHKHRWCVVTIRPWGAMYRFFKCWMKLDYLTMRLPPRPPLKPSKATKSTK